MSFVIKDAAADRFTYNGEHGLIKNTDDPQGHLKYKTWVMGCSQNMLFGFNNIFNVSLWDVEKFCEFLKGIGTCTTAGADYRGYMNRRWLFTLSHRESGEFYTANQFAQQLAAKAMKMGPMYKNLGHEPAWVQLYMLTLDK